MLFLWIFIANNIFKMYDSCLTFISIYFRAVWVRSLHTHTKMFNGEKKSSRQKRREIGFFYTRLTSFPKVCVFSYLDHFTAVILRIPLTFFFATVVHYRSAWVLCANIMMIFNQRKKIKWIFPYSFYVCVWCVWEMSFILFVVWWDSMPISNAIKCMICTL